MLLEQQDICVKEININSYFTPYLKFSSKCIIDQNIKAKTGKFKWKQKIQSWNERFFNTLKMSSEQNLLKTLFIWKSKLPLGVNIYKTTLNKRILCRIYEKLVQLENFWKNDQSRHFTKEDIDEWQINIWEDPKHN